MIHYFRVTDRSEEFRHPAPPGELLKFLQWHADNRRLFSAVAKAAAYFKLYDSVHPTLKSCIYEKQPWEA